MSVFRQNVFNFWQVASALLIRDEISAFLLELGVMVPPRYVTLSAFSIFVPSLKMYGSGAVHAYVKTLALVELKIIFFTFNLNLGQYNVNFASTVSHDHCVVSV